MTKPTVEELRKLCGIAGVDAIRLIESILRGYPESIARWDALAALKTLKRVVARHPSGGEAAQALIDSMSTKTYICGGKPVVSWVDVVDALSFLGDKKQTAAPPKPTAREGGGL
jgi:hypothetical protein